MKRNIFLYIAGWLVFCLTGCIENDVPYPTIEAVIENIETEGFVSAAINKSTATVAILVADTIDLRTARITKMQVTDKTFIIPDQDACANPALFPDSGFVHVDSLPGQVNTTINLKQPANFILRIYQDYPWQISAKHNIQRIFNITDKDGKDIRVGQPRVYEDNKNIIIYVDEGTDLSNIIVKEMRLGSSIATTRPNPTTITDFRRPVEFEVSAFDETDIWTVTVTYALESGITLTPWARRAYILGEANENTNIDIRYRRKGEEYWDMVYNDEITIEDGNFTATLRHLMPETTYEYMATIGNQVYDLSEFTTEGIQELPNAGFEDWVMIENIWYPYAQGDEQFWDTGNDGAKVVSKNITTYDENIFYSGRRSAKLASENVAVRFAAGNMFAGKFVELETVNGILDFGRPFTARPTALKGMFRYTCVPISHIGENDIEEDIVIGMNDKAHIYVAVGDWTEPVRIRTKPSERKLFDINDEHIIAYKELVVEESIAEWTQFRLDLDYRSLTRIPTHIVIVCTASKYGDYFTGGDGSTLWIDDFELLYE